MRTIIARMSAWTTILTVSRQPLSAAFLALVCKLMLSLCAASCRCEASRWLEPAAPYSGLAAGAAIHGQVAAHALAARRLVAGTAGDDDDGLGQREVVGQGEVDAGLEALRA